MFMNKSQCIIWRGFSSSSVVCYNKPEAKPVSNFYYGLNKAERKHLKRRVEKAQVDLKEKHIYKDSFKIESKYKLAEILINSEIYNKDGLIALNKPFGVQRNKLKEREESSTVITTINSAGFAPTVSIEEALPLINKHYGNGEKKFEVLFCPERFTSGILLLTFSEIVKRRVEKCFRRSLGLKKPSQMYWTVVQGLPVPEEAAERVGITTHFVQNVGKVPIIKKSFSKGEVDAGIVKPNIVEHSVLAHHTENDMSLLEVKVINARHHFVRVWLSHCVSPILGDRLFGGRVKTVMGKRILVSPNNFSSYQPPDVSANILQKLNLPAAQAEIIPPHIHLAKLKLQDLSKEGDTLITCPPPDYFNWTCEQLGLMSEEDEEDKHEGIEIIEDLENNEQE